MKNHHFCWCPVSKSSNFDHNFIKLVHIIQYHDVFLKFDNGQYYGLKLSWVIALWWWKNHNFYYVLFLNRVIFIRTVCLNICLFVCSLHPSQQSFSWDGSSWVEPVPSKVLCVCSRTQRTDDSFRSYCPLFMKFCHYLQSLRSLLSNSSNFKWNLRKLGHNA